ncbi:hypothetical protein ES319_D01G245600v1 [Gossypium barbadense]|uniref:DUF7953 domain-containing protein n=1 Tax=Gossypium barbadense TaxID=3634 RepID=A0A5J5SY77_GOSBA|nr:hypothetical protein ES319_D01G245600v1 [Gossypium barbadense]
MFWIRVLLHFTLTKPFMSCCCSIEFACMAVPFYEEHGIKVSSLCFQPLTELKSKKCKRCGFYEKDKFKSDDVFDEWEFCASDFKANGKYILFKEKELNVTFDCEECTSLPAGTFNTDTNNDNKGNELRVAIIVLIVLVASTVTIFGLMMAYKYWQKRKRQQDQARFLKLFEEGDDLEDELELGN